jgi:hypothetical protein
MEENDSKKEGPVKKKVSIPIPLRLVSSDKANLEQELMEAFEEDKVVHRQGSSEPESD